MNRYILPLLLCMAAICHTAAQPLTLTHGQCRAMALTHSEELKQAENSLAQSKLDRKIATTAYLPKFEGSATAVYALPEMDMMGAKLSMKGTYVAGIQLVQPIYTGGKITAGRKLARIGQEVAEEQLRMSRMDVIADADNCYWNYIAVLDKTKLMQQLKNMIDTLYEQTETAVEAGMATENNLLRISAKRSEIVYQQQKVANGVELCRMALCNAIGVDADTPIIPADTVITPEAPGVLNPDISSRPELHLLEKQVEASKQQVNMARADFLPTAGLSIGYNYYGNLKLNSMVDVGGGMVIPYTQKFEDGIAMGMISVKIPLFHWGEGMKKVKKARIEVENATLNLNHTSRLLDLEARQAASNLIDGWGLIASATVALEEARENLRVMQDRYDEQMSPLTDLLDAQNQWQTARSNHIEALTQYQIYRTAWLRAIGRLEP